MTPASPRKQAATHRCAKPTPTSVRLLQIVLVVFGLGSACNDGPPSVRIFSPAKGGEVTWAPLRVEADFTAQADPASFVALLNGVDVSDFFVLEPPDEGRVEAWAEGVWLPDLLLPGANLLRIQVSVGANDKWRESTFFAVGDPYPDAVVLFNQGTGGGYGADALPDVVLGGPQGDGLFAGDLDDVLSLGLGGVIVLAFEDNVVVDGPGPDLLVFENPFLELTGLVTGLPFVEPAQVVVSQDGTNWFEFPCLLPMPGTPIDPGNPPYHPGCAGVYPVLADITDPEAPHPSLPSGVPIEQLVGRDRFSTDWHPAGAGGDAFDLAQLGLGWIRYVLIQSAPVALGPVGDGNAGFDLDAVAAVNAAPATDLDANGIPDAVE